jgi:hypothetical protein
MMAAVVGAMIGLAACSSATHTSSTTTASPTPTAAPADVLAAAVTKTAGVSFRSTLAAETAATSGQLTYDSTHHISTMVIGGNPGVTDHYVITPTTMYLSGEPSLSGRTLKFALSKLGPTSALATLCDTEPALTLLSAAVTVTSTGSNQFAGTLDLSKAHAATVGAQKFLAHAVNSAGPRGGSIAFTAMMNADGYVTGFDAVMPGLNGGKDTEFRMTLSDFGAAIAITEPAGSSVIDAPASTYSIT